MQIDMIFIENVQAYRDDDKVSLSIQFLMNGISQFNVLVIGIGILRLNALDFPRISRNSSFKG